MQSIEEYRSSKKEIEKLGDEIEKLSKQLESVRQVMNILISKRNSATRLFPFDDRYEVSNYEKMERTLPEKRRMLDELRKQEQQDGRAGVDGYGIDSKKALSAIEIDEKKLRDGRSHYEELKEKQRVAEAMISQEELSKIEIYSQNQYKLRQMQSDFEQRQNAQRQQDRRDIQEFFGITGHLEHKRDPEQIVHDSKTGIDTPIAVRQTLEELKATENRLRKTLNNKHNSGEIDDDMYEMMEDKVVEEYARMQKERIEHDKAVERPKDDGR